MPRGGPLSIASIVLCSCGGLPAQLVVAVSTDFAVPAEVQMIRAVIEDASGVPVFVNDFVLDDGSVALPFSFAVVPIDGDHRRVITVALTAHRGDRSPIFTRRARTGFVESERLLLPMFLSRECESLAATCPPASTCTEGGCAPVEISAGSLRRVEPGLEFDGP